MSARLTFPLNAVSVDTLITMSLLPASNFDDAVSDVFKLEPAGLILEHPIIVDIPIRPGTPVDTDTLTPFVLRHISENDAEPRNYLGTYENNRLVSHLASFSRLYISPYSAAQRINVYITRSYVHAHPDSPNTYYPFSGGNSHYFDTINNVWVTGAPIYVDISRGKVEFAANLPADTYSFISTDEDPRRFFGTLGRVSHIDLSEYQIGLRPTVARSAQAVNVSISNLAPWEADDDIQLFSLDSNSYTDGVSYGRCTNPPAVSATTMSSECQVFTSVGIAPGDRFLATQLEATRVGNVVVSRANRGYQAFVENPLTAGDPLRLNPTMAVLPPKQVNGGDAVLNLKYRASEYAALISRVHPNATFDHWYGIVNEFYSHGTWHGAGGSPDLFTFWGLDTSDFLHDGIFPNFQFSTPHHTALFYMAVSVPTPGHSQASFTVYLETNQLDYSAELRPYTPPPTMTIAGFDAWETRNDLPLQPHVAWTLPTLPTPPSVSEVRLAVFRDNGTAWRRVGILQGLPSTGSVSIPPGWLTPGNSYLFVATAITGSDLANPLKVDKGSSFPNQKLPAVSAVMRTAP